MLEVHGLFAGYDPSYNVLHGVNLSVEPRSILAVIGSNGAGKSTLLRAISALIPVRAGEVCVDGIFMSRRSPAQLVRFGVVHVPEGRQVFPNLTVWDNLVLGGYLVRDTKVVRHRIETVLEYFPELAPRMKDFAGSLSGGQQQMLAIGRGMMADPHYILLDEPSLGLAPQATQRIFEVLLLLRENGVGILLVEQNGRLALSVADTALLLERGSVTLSGTAQELLNNEGVIEHYLGIGTVGSRGGQYHKNFRENLRRALVM